MNVQVAGSGPNRPLAQREMRRGMLAMMTVARLLWSVQARLGWRSGSFWHVKVAGFSSWRLPSRWVRRGGATPHSESARPPRSPIQQF
jgi:hypothetical protein